MAQGLLPFRSEPLPRPMDSTAHAGLTLVAETLLALEQDLVVADQYRDGNVPAGLDPLAVA